MRSFMFDILQGDMTRSKVILTFTCLKMYIARSGDTSGSRTTLFIMCWIHPDGIDCWYVTLFSKEMEKILWSNNSMLKMKHVHPKLFFLSWYRESLQFNNFAPCLKIPCSLTSFSHKLKHKDSFGKSENLSKIFFAEILVFDHDYEGKSSSSNGLLWISLIF